MSLTGLKINITRIKNLLACYRYLLPIVSLGLLFNGLPLQAGEIFTQFPKTINAEDKYVFYSHGYIVEGTNPTPKHPKYGIYQFPDIKKALATSDFHLIAYHRPANINPKEFAVSLAADVTRLIDKGVAPKNITLLGFSRGGAITAFASSNLQLNEMNTILLASCGSWVKKMPLIKLAGNVLSVYETSDRFGSCQSLIDRSEQMVSFKEIAISTGKKHGAFFIPRKEWLNPVVDWINSAKK